MKPSKLHAAPNVTVRIFSLSAFQPLSLLAFEPFSPSMASYSP
jgi:hypothetical protein